MERIWSLKSLKQQLPSAAGYTLLLTSAEVNKINPHQTDTVSHKMYSVWDNITPTHTHTHTQRKKEEPQLHRRTTLEPDCLISGCWNLLVVTMIVMFHWTLVNFLSFSQVVGHRMKVGHESSFSISLPTLHFFLTEECHNADWPQIRSRPLSHTS